MEAIALPTIDAITPAELYGLTGQVDAGAHNLPVELLTLEGYSSPKVRELLNRLVSLPGASYLEIGVHLGSTFIPAIYANHAPATCIDNWSLFGDLRPQFEANLKQVVPKRRVNVIEGDCFKVDRQRIQQGVNVYFYDGDHAREPQYQAIAYYAPVLANRFILLVDDCNWEEPRDETAHALSDLHYRAEWSTILPARFERDTEQWWNGLYVGLINKDGNP